MNDGDSGPARVVLVDTLKPLLPESWRILNDEASADAVEATTLRLSQRSIERHPVAGTTVHLITFTCTITEAGADLKASETRLDEDTDEFLWQLDTLGILWTTAKKGVYDGRLGYQLDIEVTAHADQPAAAADLDTTENTEE